MGNIFKKVYNWIRKGGKPNIGIETINETLYADILKISELTRESSWYVAYKEAMSGEFDIEKARELTNLECWPAPQSSIKDKEGDEYYIIGDMAIIYVCSSVINIECGPYSKIGEEYKIIDGTTIICDNATGSYGLDACSWWSDVKIIDMPDSLTHIGANGFREWYKLKQINISKSLQYIGYDAFSFCPNLVEVVFPKSIKCIDEWAFSSCDNLISVTFTNAEIIINEWAFFDCKKLEKIYIPRGTSNRFKAMLSEELHSKLIETDFDQNIDLLHKTQNPFENKDNWVLNKNSLFFREQARAEKDEYGVYYLPIYKMLLFATKVNENIEIKKYKLHDGVKEICENSFRGMFQFISVEIPNSVKIIRSRAFMNCCNLSDIIIPDSVVIMEKEVFSGCVNLKNIVIGNSVKWIGNEAFKGCSCLTTVVIGNSVKRIETSAFEGCSGLTSIEIPNSVTEIGGWVFDGCTNLTTIRIPDSVKNIGQCVFDNCEKLRWIIISKGSKERFKAMLDKSLHSKLFER